MHVTGRAEARVVHDEVDLWQVWIGDAIDDGFDTFRRRQISDDDFRSGKASLDLAQAILATRDDDETDLGCAELFGDFQTDSTGRTSDECPREGIRRH
jgi:hypothetical protein